LRYPQALRKVERPGDEETSPTRNRSIDFFHRKFTTSRRYLESKLVNQHGLHSEEMNSQRRVIMQQSKSAKTTESRDAKRGSEPRILVAGEGAHSEEGQLAHAFDVVVREAPPHGGCGGRLRPAQELGAAVGRPQTADVVRGLYAAQEMAKDIQHEIEKRIKEVRSLTRRAAAA